MASTKKEKNFNKLKDKFEKGTLTLAEYQKIPLEKKMEYLTKEVKRRYKQDIKVTCERCGSTLIFNTGGYISDDDLSPLVNKN